MSFVQEREKRPNAGSRMRALLDQEIDMEELFEYRDSDEEDEEFSAKENEVEEDKVDSDFDLDSSEGEQEHIEEGKALDKQIEKQEKRARRYNPPPAAVLKPVKKPVERKKRERVVSEPISESSEDRTKRQSSRKNTMLNRLLVEDQLREHNKRKALQHKKERPTVDKMTQEELLAEAAITEETNKNSLLEWQQKEAERKENSKKKDKQGMTGSFVRYHSFAEGFEEDSTDLEGRNLITFMEVGKKSSNSYRDLEKADDLELVDLIDQLASWREKPPKPNKPVLCPITGNNASYKDPETGVPYSNIPALKQIKSCLEHEQNWSPANGLYLGNLPSANGVPEGWMQSNQ